MGDKKPELVAATEALAEELSRVEQLCESAGRVPLSSRRNLEKAARTTADAAAAQTLVGERIAVMMEALTTVRLRNEATVRSMQALSDEIQRRSQELSALLERFDHIGQEAREITSLAQALTSGQTSDDAGSQLVELETRMAGVADAAREVYEQAEKGGWSDVSRDADALRQQVLATKNRVGLLAKKLAVTLSN